MQKLLSFICLFFTFGCGGMNDGARVNANDAQKNLSKPADKGKKSPTETFCKMEDILRVIKENQNTVNNCFNKELSNNSKLSGKVMMCWHIWTNGELRNARVCSSTLKNEQVESCLVSSLEHWKFPKPNGGICAVKFPFTFGSTDKLSD